tara:strand:- start:95 stop:370 length:276 start_codon:yes stop_codon:yes gene_type:complete
MMVSIFENIINIVRKRKSKPVQGSYTNRLLDNRLLCKEKVLEEINELIEAVEKDTNKVHEAADVIYHLMVFLEANDIKIEDIMNELDKRNK